MGKPEGWIYRPTPNDAGVAFVHTPGGAYIDVYWSDAMAIRGPVWAVNEDPAIPFTNINVYDYSAGLSTVRTADEFHAACDEWLVENRGDLGDYLEHSL